MCFAHAQSVDTADSQKSAIEYGLRLHYGVVYVHTKFVENTSGAQPRGAEFEISKQLKDKKVWDYYRCYPRMGFAFSYFNYDRALLGSSWSASYFLEPNFRLSNRLAFFLRTAAGLSYMTNPYDSITNPTNQSYSLHVNAFLSLGVGLNYRLSNQMALNLGASFQHNSNGGFELPNHGINYPTAFIGIRYNVYNNILPQYQKTSEGLVANRKPKVDVGVFYSPKNGYRPGWVSVRKFVTGVFGQVSKQVSTLDAVTLGAEIYYDDGLKSIKKLLGDSTSCMLAGVLIGHEFIFHKIFFSTQLGAYVYKNTATFSRLYQQPFPWWYHRWGLRYRLNNNWYAGVNLLAHKQVADFIDVRLTYRF